MQNSLINKEIKKALKEAKEKKENMLIKENIINERILMIFENKNNIKNFKKLSEEKKTKISFLVLNELSYFEKTNLLTEQDLGSILKDLFGGLLKAAPETLIFEPMFNSILNAVGFPDGLFRKTVVSFLATNPAEVIKALSDCRAFTKLLAKSFSEALVYQLQQSRGFSGLGWGLIRNSLGDAMQDSVFIQKIEDGLANTVCNLLSKYSSNAQDVSDKLKPVPVTK